MKPNASTCDPQRIALFLEQKLSNADQEAFESHLTSATIAAGDWKRRQRRRGVWTGVRSSCRTAKYLQTTCRRATPIRPPRMLPPARPRY